MVRCRPAAFRSPAPARLMGDPPCDGLRRRPARPRATGQGLRNSSRLFDRCRRPSGDGRGGGRAVGGITRRGAVEEVTPAAQTPGSTSGRRYRQARQLTDQTTLTSTSIRPRVVATHGPVPGSPAAYAEGEVET